ncbi:MAG: outer membrane protein assembly factor BamD [Alphaproteobacteria bacterium]|nr:MAG: outer membrane protein assembly factor BamD [Alphaproteobacteria bacterium]
MKNKIILVPVLMAAVLAGCASGKPEGELTGTVGSLYNDGMDDIQGKRYPKAVHNFEELERQYPYSGWATRGQIMTAYAQLMNEDYDESLATIERFIKMHPGHQHLAYMYYLAGLNHYYQMTDVNRDQSQTQLALDAFNEVVNRFPQSPYARDAKLKITLCADHLAGKEMTVGRYYQKQRLHLAAINRFRNVVQNYQTSSQTPEALYRLTESYVSLGVDDEAVRAASILGHNYPGSKWYAEAYDLLTTRKLAPAGQKESWAKRISEGFEDLF